MNDLTPLTVIEHLDELRKRVFIAFGAILTGAIGCYFFSDRLLQLLIKPVEPEINQVYFFSPADAFLVKCKIALLAGLFVASPLVLTQVWFFVSPALYRREKKIIIPLLMALAVFFLLGVAFCFYAVVPMTLKFLLGLQTPFLKPMISLTSYIDFLLGMLLAFGIAFNLPLFIWALVFLGFLSVAALNRYQRHAIVLIFIAAAILTPSPDISGQILLAIPLVFLYEMSILGAWVIERLRKKPVLVSTGDGSL